MVPEEEEQEEDGPIKLCPLAHLSAGQPGAWSPACPPPPQGGGLTDSATRPTFTPGSPNGHRLPREGMVQEEGGMGMLVERKEGGEEKEEEEEEVEGGQEELCRPTRPRQTDLAQ